MVRASFRPVPALPCGRDPRRRLRRGGGIGRRAWFRSMWGQPRGGSSPLLGTTSEPDASHRSSQATHPPAPSVPLGATVATTRQTVALHLTDRSVREFGAEPDMFSGAVVAEAEFDSRFVK